MSHSTGPISQLRTAALAALIAVLVWIFAEGESVASRPVVATVTFPFEPVGDLLILPDPTFRGAVRVRLEGTTRTIDLAAAAISGDIQLRPGMPGVPELPGQQSVDLRKAISSLPRLKDLGGTLVEVSPEAVVVTIVRLVTKEVPVRAELGAVMPLEVEPTCEPATVKVLVPVKDSERIPEGAFAVAMVSGQEIRRLTSKGGAAFANGGVQVVRGVVRAPDEAAGIEPILVKPEQVVVNLRLKSHLDVLKIPTVAVWIGMPSTEDAGQWIVEVQDKVVTDVSLTGPADELERIRSGRVSVRAMVELSRDDLVRGITSKAATFPGLPPGVTASANLVRLAKIVKRDPEPGKP